MLSDNSSLFEAYQPLAGHFDECKWPDGQLRANWVRFLEKLERQPQPELMHRNDQLLRLISDHGVTYNVHAETESYERSWNLDMLPLLIDSNEADFLESALSQRALLLSWIYRDIYGPRQILADRRVPDYLVHANPGFLRAVAGSSVERNPLHFYTVDLARGPDGAWWILDDHLEFPKGLGYCLENRLLTTRIFPGLTKQLGIAGHENFMESLLESTFRLHHPMNGSPRIVLLSSGTDSETFHEQSFLARNLDFTLVEDSDLLIRNGRVYLKTVRGTEPVDIVIRQVGGNFCDPLEIRSGDQAGVPGLMDVVRQGNVAMANNPGMGVLECNALPAFLPKLAKEVLGEDLILPSAATWWCGQESERNYVLSHLSDLIVRNTFDTGSGRIYTGRLLSQKSLQRLKEQILANPCYFTAHEEVKRGTTPEYCGGRLVSKECVVRFYLVQTDNGWKLLPGGLGRIVQDENTPPFKIQAGEKSKDVWILNSQSENHFSTVPEKAVVNLKGVSHALTSRLADNLFWLGRYAERAEGAIRLLRVVIESVAGESDDTLFPVIEPFMRQMNPGYGFGEMSVEALENELQYLIRSKRNSSSIVTTFSRLYSVATSAKERFSSQMWHQVLRLEKCKSVFMGSRPIFGDELSRLLDDTLEALAGFSGLVMENMSHGEAWLFMELGKRVERMDFLTRLVKECLKTQSSKEEQIIRMMLRCADSGMSYRRRYLNHIHSNGLLDLLVFEVKNPRSISFQHIRLTQAFERLSNGESLQSGGVQNLKALMESIEKLMTRWPIDDLLRIDSMGRRVEFDTLTTLLLDRVYQIGSVLEHQYFAHSSPDFNLILSN